MEQILDWWFIASLLWGGFFYVWRRKKLHTLRVRTRNAEHDSVRVGQQAIPPRERHTINQGDEKLGTDRVRNVPLNLRGDGLEQLRAVDETLYVPPEPRGDGGS